MASSPITFEDVMNAIEDLATKVHAMNRSYAYMYRQVDKVFGDTSTVVSRDDVPHDVADVPSDIVIPDIDATVVVPEISPDDDDDEDDVVIPSDDRALVVPSDALIEGETIASDIDSDLVDLEEFHYDYLDNISTMQQTQWSIVNASALNNHEHRFLVGLVYAPSKASEFTVSRTQNNSSLETFCGDGGGRHAALQFGAERTPVFDPGPIEFTTSLAPSVIFNVGKIFSAANG